MAKLKPQKRRRPRAARLSEDPIVWPEGYYRVTSGPIRPDDLVLSVMTREWLRHDDPGWSGGKATDAEDAYMVARKARHQPAADQAVKGYTIKRDPEPEPPAAPIEPAKGQTSLFE